MYLSVPLPRAMERQLAVTYIPANGEAPTRCVVSLNKQSRIGKLKEELLQTLGKNVATSNVALAEVLENHIARILVRYFVRLFLAKEEQEGDSLFRFNSRRYYPPRVIFIW